MVAEKKFDHLDEILFLPINSRVVSGSDVATCDQGAKINCIGGWFCTALETEQSFQNTIIICIIWFFLSTTAFNYIVFLI